VLVALMLLVIFIPGAATAQSRADLLAAGQQAASTNGVPWNLFNAQIQGESGWNPSVPCSSSGACGIAQFIPSTAAQYGVDVTDPISSLNGAAAYDAALFAKYGSWTAVLTAYTGGLSPDNPGNAAYRLAFQDAMLLDSGATNASLDPLGGGNTDAPSPAVPSAPSALSAPFSWAWNHIMQQAIDHVDDAVTNVEGMVWTPALALLALAIAVWGYRAIMGL
jgi:hypothetical protein